MGTPERSGAKPCGAPADCALRLAEALIEVRGRGATSAATSTAAARGTAGRGSPAGAGRQARPAASPSTAPATEARSGSQIMGSSRGCQGWKDQRWVHSHSAGSPTIAAARPASTASASGVTRPASRNASSTPAAAPR